MPTYIVLGNFTEQGVRNFRDSPQRRRGPADLARPHRAVARADAQGVVEDDVGRARMAARVAVVAELEVAGVALGGRVAAVAYDPVQAAVARAVVPQLHEPPAGAPRQPHAEQESSQMPRGSGRGFQPQRGSSPRRRPFARACSDTRGAPSGWIWKRSTAPGHASARRTRARIWSTSRSRGPSRSAAWAGGGRRPRAAPSAPRGRSRSRRRRRRSRCEPRTGRHRRPRAPAR